MYSYLPIFGNPEYVCIFIDLENWIQIHLHLHLHSQKYQPEYIFIVEFAKNFNPNIFVFVFGPVNCICHTLISRTIGSKVGLVGWMCTFCLLVELHQEGSAIIGATPSIFNCAIKIINFAMLFLPPKM